MMTTERDEKGVRAILQFARDCLWHFEALLRQAATPEGSLADRPTPQHGPATAAKTWLAQRFDTRQFREVDWRVATFLLGLWLDPTLFVRLEVVYPGIRSGWIPMEVVSHVLDHTGENALETRSALGPKAPICQAGIASVRPPFVFPAYHTLPSDVEGERMSLSPPVASTRPPWVVPLSSGGHLNRCGYREGARAALREIAMWWRHRQTVLETWNFRRLVLSSSCGIIALFAGPPGSGRREAATMVATDLGLVLWEVVSPRLLSRYVGEAEERLHDVFQQAAEQGTGLYFSEAEDLLSQRMAVRSANDRYSNLMVDTFLQEADHFPGLLILAVTNEATLDPAVRRRVNVKAQFAWPDEGQRTAIWQACAQTVPGFSLSLEQARLLGEAFAFTAAEIESALLSAATLAAHRRERLDVRHLWEACRSRAVGRGDLVRTGDA